MGSETIRGFLQDNGLAVRSALRKEAQAFEENDFIDRFPVPDWTSGRLRWSTQFWMRNPISPTATTGR
jgi:hypothetical protein